MKKARKAAASLVRILVSAVLLYLVFAKIDFSSVWSLVNTSEVGFLLLALVAFIASQWVSSLRLLAYFRASGFYLSTLSSHALYLLGMFYNFFIPGGIGGDAYKVYLLNKRFAWGIKPLTYSVLNDRLSGLVAIIVLVLALVVPLLPGWWKLLALPGIAMAIGAAHMMINRLFPAFRGIFFSSLGYSLAVQVLQLLCVYFTLVAFRATEGSLVYFLVFLMSAILSVVSFSGIGVREWLFLQASQRFDFHSEIAVSVALLFSCMTVLVALFGVFYQLAGTPLKHTETTG
ncbi:lysylphosphatidylglycerol synthase transmembrane domain-containing protein [Parapedobacter koreensis]|uniref:Lysylphosphatidylglycerol synthase TM region n=1 Tax=Parapedobacter koreensis TaxID=332977 RepID=A0A1H7LD60_9SPHI|nr:lysylphosphatidylglycerol synthase transmembrane domain-containing protein [Parapedobacter koreensis]SEK96818.1 hypothetical protein SAMN05421740_103125 [Parapedobacter koreensis]